ncbi:hypothetical protein D3C71_1936230 [compost metagenome]
MLLNRWFALVHYHVVMLKTLGFPKTLLKVIANSLMLVMVIVLKCGMKAKWSVVYMVSPLGMAVLANPCLARKLMFQKWLFIL